MRPPGRTAPPRRALTPCWDCRLRTPAKPGTRPGSPRRPVSGPPPGRCTPTPSGSRCARVRLRTLCPLGRRVASWSGLGLRRSRPSRSRRDRSKSGMPGPLAETAPPLAWSPRPPSQVDGSPPPGRRRPGLRRCGVWSEGSPCRSREVCFPWVRLPKNSGRELDYSPTIIGTFGPMSRTKRTFLDAFLCPRRSLLCAKTRQNAPVPQPVHRKSKVPRRSPLDFSTPLIHLAPVCSRVLLRSKCYGPGLFRSPRSPCYAVFSRSPRTLTFLDDPCPGLIFAFSFSVPVVGREGTAPAVWSSSFLPCLPVLRIRR